MSEPSADPHASARDGAPLVDPSEKAPPEPQVVEAEKLLERQTRSLMIMAATRWFGAM
jgi:hypothetical protein